MTSAEYSEILWQDSSSTPTETEPLRVFSDRRHIKVGRLRSGKLRRDGASSSRQSSLSARGRSGRYIWSNDKTEIDMLETTMSKTALTDALKKFDLDKVRKTLKKNPELKHLQLDKGLNLLQFCCRRSTEGDSAAADRQLRLAKWLVSEGFDPLAMHTTAPGDDGEEDPANVSLVFFAVARAQNNRLARFFLQQGARPGALFAAAWWGNADIIEDLVKHGDDLNAVVGATPFHMAVDVLQRGVEGKPDRARRRFRTLKEMLTLGADPNIAAFNGVTPLHTVLQKSYDIEVFKLLLRHGANPDVPGKDGRTVREIAARKKDKRYFNALGS